MLVEEAKVSKKDTVLEIGAGTGFLTQELLKKAEKVVAVELQEELVQVLRNELPQENLQIIGGNFLTARLPKFNKIVSTPPYNISSKIMHRLFKEKFFLAVLVFQKDYCEKLLAEPGFKENCATSILTHYFFLPTIEAIIPAKEFFPSPKTDSAVLKLVSKKRFGNAKNDSDFEFFLEQVFRYKNKNLYRALHNSLPFLKEKLSLSEEKLEKVLENHKLNERKVNLLEVREWIELFNSLF